MRGLFRPRAFRLESTAPRNSDTCVTAHPPQCPCRSWSRGGTLLCGARGQSLWMGSLLWRGSGQSLPRVPSQTRLPRCVVRGKLLNFPELQCPHTSDWVGEGRGGRQTQQKCPLSKRIARVRGVCAHTHNGRHRVSVQRGRHSLSHAILGECCGPSGGRAVRLFLLQHTDRQQHRRQQTADGVSAEG